MIPPYIDDNNRKENISCHHHFRRVGMATRTPQVCCIAYMVDHVGLLLFLFTSPVSRDVRQNITWSRCVPFYKTSDLCFLLICFRNDHDFRRVGMATPEDHALRAALVGFNIGLFGDHRSILRRQPDTTVKVDHDYFIRWVVLPCWRAVCWNSVNTISRLVLTHSHAPKGVRWCPE